MLISLVLVSTGSGSFEQPTIKAIERLKGSAQCLMFMIVLYIWIYYSNHLLVPEVTISNVIADQLNNY